MNYGIGFGDLKTKAGEIFKFTDFDLKYLGSRDLTEEEKALKQKSIAAQVDGGNSMLSPANLFLILEKSGNNKEIELQTLPYANSTFEIAGQKFELRNSLTPEAMWIVRLLK